MLRRSFATHWKNSCQTIFRQNYHKKHALANSTVNFRHRLSLHTKGHRMLHSRQGPLDRHSLNKCVRACIRPLCLSLSLPRSFSLKWDTSRSFMSWSLLSLPSVRKTHLYHLISFVITAITLALGYTLMLLRTQRSFLSTACKRLTVRQIRRAPVFNRPILARSTIRSD